MLQPLRDLLQKISQTLSKLSIILQRCCKIRKGFWGYKGTFFKKFPYVFIFIFSLWFSHKSCDKSFRNSQKYRAIPALKKFAQGSNLRCTNGILLSRFFRWSEAPSNLSDVVQPALVLVRYHSSEHRSRNFASVHARLCLLTASKAQQSLYSNFRLALTVRLLYVPIPRCDCMAFP